MSILAVMLNLRSVGCAHLAGGGADRAGQGAELGVVFSQFAGKTQRTSYAWEGMRKPLLEPSRRLQPPSWGLQLGKAKHLASSTAWFQPVGDEGGTAGCSQVAKPSQQCPKSRSRGQGLVAAPTEQSWVDRGKKRCIRSAGCVGQSRMHPQHFVHTAWVHENSGWVFPAGISAIRGTWTALPLLLLLSSGSIMVYSIYIIYSNLQQWKSRAWPSFSIPLPSPSITWAASTALQNKFQRLFALLVCQGKTGAYS